MLVPAVAPPFALTCGFSTCLDAPDRLPPRRLEQIHGAEVVPATGSLQRADGLWTQEPGLAIGVRVADCAPILLAGLAQGRPWAAALHAGWRGATAGILRRGVALFQELGGRPEDLTWAVGPAIGPCHFEVGEEVLQAARQDAAWQDSLATPGPRGRPHFDLPGFLTAQAQSLGLDPARNGSVQRCTFCASDLLYSYRRGDQVERQWGWVQIG